MADLPVVGDGGPARGERADAARNRARILRAAAELVRERGIDGVSMDDVARAACVGTGTLYRRFGDRAGLAFALLDEQTRAFQDGFIAGPPPLGPGAPARERLEAFGLGMLELLEAHADLLLTAEAVPAPGGPHDTYLTHLALLLREVDPALDAPVVAEALLATLAPGPFVRSRRLRGWPLERLADGWRSLVARL